MLESFIGMFGSKGILWRFPSNLTLSIQKTRFMRIGKWTGQCR